MEKVFIVSSPGLVPFTIQELQHLNLLTAQTSCMNIEAGGIEFRGSIEDIYRTNLLLRTASRVLLRMGEFHAATFPELRKHVQQLPWERFLHPGQGVAMRVTCHKSRLYHSAAVAREVIASISSRLGKPVQLLKFDEDQDRIAPQLLIVRLVNDQCTLSIDTTGPLLHRRGYRLETAKAPLRETLAAGIILASGWDGTSPLLDPFCGSGTIAIEAALIACQIVPGSSRKFAFMDWPSYMPDLWTKILTAHTQPANSSANRSATCHPVLASDRDAGAIAIAQANAERAGVGQFIEFSQRAVSSIEPAGIGWVVTNPPYGKRVSANKDLRNLYAQFGNVLRHKCPGWHLAILCSDLSLLHQLQLTLDTNISLINGGISVRLGRATIPPSRIN